MWRTVLIVGGSVVGGLIAVVGTIAAFAAPPSAKSATTDPPPTPTPAKEPQPVPEVEAEPEVTLEDKPAVSRTPRKVKVPANSYPSEKRVAAERLKRKFNPKA